MARRRRTSKQAYPCCPSSRFDRSARAPLRHRAPLEHLAELTCGVWKQDTGAPVEDHGMLADHVERADRAAAIFFRHDLGIEPHIGETFGPDFGAERRGRYLVDLVFAEFGVDGMHDNAIIRRSAFDRDIIVL